MGYWSATDLAQYVPRLAGTYPVTPSGPMTASQFQTIIDLRSSEVDQAAAKAGYQTPIPSSATQGFEVAQRVTRDGAIADMLRTVFTGPDPKLADRYQTAYDNALKAISAGDMPLPGAPPDTSSQGAVKPIWSGIASAVFTPTAGFTSDLGLIPSDF